ncbi:hypothetical protein N7495_000143 [Penicillium taxi]|uniref:uncharacterized protein n=1 Tax=Penicillium taxi TaxID=168475 RepID=UPI00254596C9|nr:uncharacterized protein N7495_000143 [Penicillium taxi]KAJ5907461.1 hypothetical protein N7495_000143 [Penicillium taxi]
MGPISIDMEPNKTHNRRRSQFSFSSPFRRRLSFISPAGQLPTCEEKIHYPIFDASDPRHSFSPPESSRRQENFSSSSESQKQPNWVQQLPRRSIHKARSGLLAIAAGWSRRSGGTRDSEYYEDTPSALPNFAQIGSSTHHPELSTASTQEEDAMGVDLHRTKSSVAWESAHEPSIDTLMKVTSMHPLTLVSSAPQVLESSSDLRSEGSPRGARPMSRQPSYTVVDHTTLISDIQSVPMLAQNPFPCLQTNHWGTDGSSDSEPTCSLENNHRGRPRYLRGNTPTRLRRSSCATTGTWEVFCSINGGADHQDLVTESEDIASPGSEAFLSRALPICLRAGVIVDGADSDVSDIHLSQHESQETGHLLESLASDLNVLSISAPISHRSRSNTTDHDAFSTQEWLQLHSRASSHGPATSSVARPREISTSSVKVKIAFPGIHRALMEQHDEDHQCACENLLNECSKPVGVDNEHRSNAAQVSPPQFQEFQDTMTCQELRVAFETREVDRIIPIGLQESDECHRFGIHMDHETLGEFVARRNMKAQAQPPDDNYPPQYDGGIDDRPSGNENHTLERHESPGDGARKADQVQSQQNATQEPPVWKKDPAQHGECMKNHLLKRDHRYGLHVSCNEEHETLEEFVAKRKFSPREKHYMPQYDGCINDRSSGREIRKSDHKSPGDEAKELERFQSRQSMQVQTFAEYDGCSDKCGPTTTIQSEISSPTFTINSMWSPIDSSTDEDGRFSNFQADELSILGRNTDAQYPKQGPQPAKVIQCGELDDLLEMLLVQSVRTHPRRRHPSQVEESESKEDFFSCQWE